MNARILLAMSTIVIACNANAMMLNSSGEGQVLVFPYYTVNGGNSTLISIVNTTSDGKALKLKFHEGYNGRDVLDLNVYLAPFDTWAGEVADAGSSDSDGATLFSEDASCTIPALASVVNRPGLFSIQFSDANYLGENTAAGPTGNSDGGPVTIDRTREGHMDVIEMGVLTNAAHDSLANTIAMSASSCAQLVNAWSDNGYWTENATTDLSPPSGGLYGTEAIVDVAQGIFYSVNAAAIDGFSTAVMHTAPGDATPDLNTPSPSSNGLTTAFVPVNGKMLELDYNRPVDAVSALFMVDVLSNDFDKSTDVGAMSDWVFTTPTKRFYVDSRYIGNLELPPPPFDETFSRGYQVETTSTGGGAPQFGFATAFPYSCVYDTPIAYSRDGYGFLVSHEDNDGSFVSRSLTPCLETSVLTFETSNVDSPNGPLPQPLSALGSHLTNATDPSDTLTFNFGDVDTIPFTQGFLRLDLSHDGDEYSPNLQFPPPIEQQYLTAASNGDVLYGLPVTGFLAVKYTNETAQSGILANYSGAYPHHGSVRCANASVSNQQCN